MISHEENSQNQGWFVHQIEKMIAKIWQNNRH
jgi:hypothetical protein